MVFCLKLMLYAMHCERRTYALVGIFLIPYTFYMMFSLMRSKHDVCPFNVVGKEDLLPN